MLKPILHSCFAVSVLVSNLALAQAEAPAPGGAQEFDTGSRISLHALTPTQVENLAVTGKVWGFLKYHHPVLTKGQRQWDMELLRILPEILAAKYRAKADAILVQWIGKLGPVAQCNPCASLKEQDYPLLPNLAWLGEPRLLSPGLRDTLNKIYRNRSGEGKQFYVSLAQGVGNPEFNNEPNYQGVSFPDAGFQLLSLFRLWNIVEYWSPYRDQVGEDWNNVLHQSIAPVALAKDRAAYELAMIAVVARIHDSHTNLWSSLHVRPPVGQCRLPVRVRFVEGRAMVTGYADEEAGAASGLKRGDIIEAIGGVPVVQLVEAWRPYYAASNEPARLRDMAEGLPRGDCSPVQVRLGQGSEAKELSVGRIPRNRPRQALTHDRAGDTFQLLSNDVAYIKLSSIKRADIPGYMARAAHTKGLIVDIRNYPSEFVPFALGQYFIDKPTNFARFTIGDLNNPGGFRWSPPLELRPHATPYTGKVMVLVDEVSQSQAEYTAMALRVGPRAKVVGSTTAGADGNLSTIPLPGGLSSAISGIGVFYPDKRPTQRIGIVPDIVVKPTIEGLRAGRDEVLDAAIAEIRRE